MTNNDGNLSDYWRDVREYRQDKRTANRRSSDRVLRDAGISFEEKNGGSHLIVRQGDHVIDFWPGTGLWINRSTPRDRRRGVFTLIDFLLKGPRITTCSERKAVSDE